MAVQTFAAIEVGSFGVEMGIYEISNKNGIRQIDHVRHVIALGKDTYGTGKISYQVADELCRVLKDFSDIMKGYKVQGYKACGTSALRDAKNNQIILDQIQVRTGIDVKMISNSEQRYLNYKAIASKDREFNNTIQKGTAIVDVGFGSLQLSLFDKDSLVSTQNLPLGILRIQEMIAKIPGNMEVHRHLVREMVDKELITYRKIYLKDRGIKNLIGIGDNSLYLLQKALAKERTVPDRMTAEDVNHFYDALFKMNPQQLEDVFGISKEYVELVLPSAVIYKRILEVTGAEQFWLPGIRLCDGLAAGYAEGTKLVKFKHDFEEDILAASRNMAKRYKCHAGHNQIVEQFAMDIFDAMRKFHGLTSRDKLLLRIAVLLHACGKYISMKNSTECAYDIIKATEIIGLGHLEREMVANVVRYNVRDFDYGQVQIEAQIYKGTTDILDIRDITIKIAKLTAILRLANSMDRSHQQKLAGCKTVVRDGQLVITTDYQKDITLEQMSFNQKAGFFEEIFGIRPILKQKRRI